MQELDIKDVSLFHGLSDQEFSVLRYYLVEKHFSAGESIHQAGANCAAVFIVRSGRVKIFRSSCSGKEQIYEILERGDSCACHGAEPGWKCGGSAVAMTDSWVWFLTREMYAKLLMIYPCLMRSLNELLAKRLRAFGHLIEEVTLKKSRKRVIQYLLENAKIEKTSRGLKSIVHLPSPREQMAQQLGVTRETVERQLLDLKSENLVDFEGDRLILLERARLEELSL